MLALLPLFRCWRVEMMFKTNNNSHDAGLLQYNLLFGYIIQIYVRGRKVCKVATNCKSLRELAAAS